MWRVGCEVEKSTCNYCEMFTNCPAFMKPEISLKMCKLEPMSKLWISEIELLKYCCSAVRNRGIRKNWHHHITAHSTLKTPAVTCRLSGKERTGDSLPKYGFPGKQHIQVMGSLLCYTKSFSDVSLLKVPSSSSTLLVYFHACGCSQMNKTLAT